MIDSICICWCFISLTFLIKRAKFQLSYVLNVELFSYKVLDALFRVLYDLLGFYDSIDDLIAFQPTSVSVRICRLVNTAFLLYFYHFKIFRTTLCNVILKI